MDKLLDILYKEFIKELQDLKFGHSMNEKHVCEMWELLQAIELYNSEFLNLYEREQILEYYD